MGNYPSRMSVMGVPMRSSLARSLVIVGAGLAAIALTLPMYGYYLEARWVVVTAGGMPPVLLASGLTCALFVAAAIKGARRTPMPIVITVVTSSFVAVANHVGEGLAARSGHGGTLLLSGLAIGLAGLLMTPVDRGAHEPQMHAVGAAPLLRA
jgi:hypothetical protein